MGVCTTLKPFAAVSPTKRERESECAAVNAVKEGGSKGGIYRNVQIVDDEIMFESDSE